MYRFYQIQRKAAPFCMLLKIIKGQCEKNPIFSETGIYLENEGPFTWKNFVCINMLL